MSLYVDTRRAVLVSPNIGRTKKAGGYFNERIRYRLFDENCESRSPKLSLEGNANSNKLIPGIRFILTQLHFGHVAITCIKRRGSFEIKSIVVSNSFTGFLPMPESF